MAIRFFHSTSYSTHPYSAVSLEIKNEPDIQPVGVRAYVEKNPGIAFNPDLDITDIIKVRKALGHSIKFYGERLANLDPVSFNYLNESQRIACEEELLYIFYIVSAEYQLHLFEGSSHNLKKRGRQLERCANLLNALRTTPGPGEKKSPERVLQDVIDDSPDKPAAYVALTVIAPEIAETMLGFTTTEYLIKLKKSMSDANVYRLNWVWGGGLDSVLLDLMPGDVGRTHQAKSVFSDIAPVTGYMSWVLYYFRLGIELYFLTKHTIKGSWMDPWASKEDKSIQLGIGTRFLTQWDLRKFNILNDALWATANMACFFWLIGEGTLGYMGNALTAVLLLVDLTLVTWGYLEKKTEHAKTMSQYDEDIDLLRVKIDTETDETRKKVLEIHCNVLVEAREKCAFDWKYSEKQWIQDVWYAVGLFATFSMLCCFFFPPAALLPSTVLILGITGAALSFLITIGSHAWATSTDIEKLQVTIARDEITLEGLQEKLEQLKREDNATLDSEIKGLELNISHRQDDLIYQKEMIGFHGKSVIIQSLSEAMVPATAFAILVFMPLSYGLLVLIPTVAVLMMAGTLLGLNEPQAPDSPDDKLPATLPGFAGP